MAFSNVSFLSANCSDGPVDGNFYSVTASTSLMYQKSSTGDLIKTIPLGVGLQTDPVGLAWDGFYFYMLFNLGLLGQLGISIQKWKLNDNETLLSRLPGEFNLLHTSFFKYKAGAFSVQTCSDTLKLPAAAGATAVYVNNPALFQAGEEIYIGPSTPEGPVKDNAIISYVYGDGLVLDRPLAHAYASGDNIVVRKSYWVFNNYSGLDPSGGSLLQINSYTHDMVWSTSPLYNGVTAAYCYQGDVAFVKRSQLFRYIPYPDPSAGMLRSSMFLNNTALNQSFDVYQVYGLVIRSGLIYKLQDERRVYQVSTKSWIEESSSTPGTYNLDLEPSVATIKSMTIKRNRGYLWGLSDEESFTIKVTDQYDFPAYLAQLTVEDDDINGFIKPGFESPVTDTNGECETIYVTGGSTSVSRTVALKVTDVNGLRVSHPVVQFSKLDEPVSFRQDKRTGTIRLNQSKVIANILRPQVAVSADNPVVIEQIFDRSRVSLVQTVQSNKVVVNQNLVATSRLRLQQDELAQGSVNLNQFPFLTFAIPAPYSLRNDPGTYILIRVVGFEGVPLNTNRAYLFINDLDVTASTTITAIMSGGVQVGVEFFYQPPLPFPFGSTVKVEVRIEDKSIPVRTISYWYYFYVIEDYLRPFVSQVYPIDGEPAAAIDTEIWAIIGDLETGIDLESIKLLAEGITLAHTISYVDQGRIKVEAQPQFPFRYGVDISANISCTDLVGNHLRYGWSFRTQPSPGVLILPDESLGCRRYISVSGPLCSEFFGLQEGLNSNTIEFIGAGLPLEYSVVPKIYKAG